MQSSYMPHLQHSHASATTTKAARGGITRLRAKGRESRVVGNESSVLHPLAVAFDSEGVGGVHQLFGAWGRVSNGTLLGTHHTSHIAHHSSHITHHTSHISKPTFLLLRLKRPACDCVRVSANATIVQFLTTPKIYRNINQPQPAGHAPLRHQQSDGR